MVAPYTLQIKQFVLPLLSFSYGYILSQLICVFLTTLDNIFSQF